ncbi:hypothetical protein [Exiguobacterium acetylicum]|uniref:hypothetical protein n=1 Tax=Exiguobacterium acetylicum TaxID=41170 RepID=UPI001CA68FAE|nr:hypothetical protein [Exiguobacterium acetylicum]QZY88645.1 hypothetical protein K7G97_17200 [Exiguobacterium acetylicum]
MNGKDYLSNSTNMSNETINYIRWTTKENANIKNVSGVKNVYSSTELVKMLDKKVDKLIIDKDILNKENNVIFLNREIKKQSKISVIILGYGNPTYVFFKKLLINSKGSIPEFTESQYKRMSMKKGFSVAYKSADGNIYGKGYDKEEKLKKVLFMLLKTDEDIKKFLN